MSFDVFLIASDASPSGTELHTATDRALAICGARRGGDGECDFVLASGHDQEFFGEGDEPGGMFALRGLGREVVELIFALAEATQCFVMFPGGEPVALRTPSNKGVLDGGDHMPTAPVATPGELAERLGAPFGDWAGYADAVTSDRLAAEDDDDEPDIDPTLLDRFFKPSNKD